MIKNKKKQSTSQCVH